MRRESGCWMERGRRRSFIALMIMGMMAFSAVGEDGAGVWDGRKAFAQAERELLAAGQAARKGNAEEGQKRQEKAQELFRKARTLFENGGIHESTEVGALVDYANVLRVFGDVDLAAAALERTVKLTPDDAMCWIRLGRVLDEVQPPKPGEAEAALKHALALEPDPPIAADAHAVLGKLYWDQGLYDFAGEQFDKAAKLNEEQWLARVGQAAVLTREGKVTEANAILDKAAASPDASEALVALNEMLPKALADFRKSGGWFEDTAANHAAYGALLLRGGFYAESLGPLERAVKLDPKDLVAWNMLGSISARMGQKQRAIEAFRRSLAIKPDQPRTQQSLRALEASLSASGQ